jgi:hypothetical protein
MGSSTAPAGWPGAQEISIQENELKLGQPDARLMKADHAIVVLVRLDLRPIGRGRTCTHATEFRTSRRPSPWGEGSSDALDSQDVRRRAGATQGLVGQSARAAFPRGGVVHDDHYRCRGRLRRGPENRTGTPAPAGMRRRAGGIELALVAW